MNANSSPLTYFAPAARRSAAEIADQVAALTADFDGLRPLLDSIPGAVIVLNPERQILAGNQAFRQFADGLGRSTCEGLRFGEFLSCHRTLTAPSGCGTSEACRLCGAIQAMLGALTGQRTERECRIATRDGDAFDFRVTASPFVWGGRSYLLVAVNDLSDQKRRQVLEQAFFHDVLNAATSLAGLAAVLRNEPALCYDLKDDLAAGAEALISEITGQRMLRAAEHDELLVRPATVGVTEVLHTVRGLHRNHPAGAGKQVEIECAAGEATVTTDPAILQRVLGDMLKNALEASRSGDTVWLGADLTTETVIFWCHNEGRIPAEAAFQVFQRSFSTKGPGRGIGTYSLKLLGERFLGGQVAFSTSAEDGTRFTLTLRRR
ncbi:MAG: histidine kinase [Verrucomicrobia bacterium]|nr:histidine kinase [Verrucomicrobiota bacterium]